MKRTWTLEEIEQELASDAVICTAESNLFIEGAGITAEPIVAPGDFSIRDPGDVVWEGKFTAGPAFVEMMDAIKHQLNTGIRLPMPDWAGED